MDEHKKTKVEKVGPDGLTKKQRRALKVQEKQNVDGEIQRNTSNTLKEIPKNITENKDVSKDSTKKPKGNTDKNLLKTSEIKQDKTQNRTNDSNVLTEKQLRKLEWEKKLAEQKKTPDADKTLSKAEQKAKRRELQESQRLAKQKPVEKPVHIPKEHKNEQPIKSNQAVSNISANKDLSKKLIPKTSQSKVSRVQLLHHLYFSDTKSIDENNCVCYPNIHPAFIQLGVQYAKKTILGANSRSISLLSALKKLVLELKAPSKQEFCRYLELVLQACTDYIQKCRPMAVSMNNALRLFKLQLTQMDVSKSDDQKKEILSDFIDTYIKNEILLAGEAISAKVSEKISNGDVILIYGCSSLIRKILIDAHTPTKQFKVIVVDGRPLLEGREQLRKLTQAGIQCTYIMINALSYVMPSVSKVLLGAHALLANGYVMSRTGTAQVALVAQAYNKPVLVCCETYKFSEKVQTDSLVYNEIGDPESLLFNDTSEELSPLNKWKENGKLTPLNILYDVTPPDLVTAVVTELAILPCTSVPVVLRTKTY